MLLLNCFLIQKPQNVIYTFNGLNPWYN